MLEFFKKPNEVETGGVSHRELYVSNVLNLALAKKYSDGTDVGEAEWMTAQSGEIRKQFDKIVAEDPDVINRYYDDSDATIAELVSRIEPYLRKFPEAPEQRAA